jgi:type II secretory pathway component PulJ
MHRLQEMRRITTQMERSVIRARMRSGSCVASRDTFMHARFATKPATDSQSRGIPIKMYAPIVPFQDDANASTKEKKSGTCHRMLERDCGGHLAYSLALSLAKQSKVRSALPQDAT